MTDDPARPPQPGAAPQDGPPPPPPGPAATPTDAPTPPPAGSAGPPPGASTAGSAPFADAPPPGYAPPPGTAGFTSRYGLVRPRDGRYLAGVCAAIGRATNTDPVLWRVLLAVLGFFGGIGILVYVTAWLIIPGEGDTASPVESMLGRGRSSMSPITVIVLSIAVAVGFGYVVTNAFRAILLGAVILIGGALLLNRDQRGPLGRRPAAAGPGTPPGPAAWPGSGATPPAGTPATGPAWSGSATAGPAATPTTGAPGWPTSAPATPAWPEAPTAATPTWAAMSAETVDQPVGGTRPASDAGPAPQVAAGWSDPERTAAQPAWPATGHPAEPAPGSGAAWPGDATPAWSGAPTTGTPPGQPVSVPPPAPVAPGGYRLPFAPHGPYAQAYPPAPPAPARPARPPKRPKERSALGAVTFSLIFLALGVVTLLDLLDVFTVGAAGYFAAALATIGLGLLVGTWFGRARWLIALGLVTAAALGIATVADSYDRIRGIDGNVTWAPADYRDLAVRYQNNFGDAVLDLRAVDFDKKDTQITVDINFGKATVVVPPNVDVTTVTDVNAGDATVFGRRTSAVNGRQGETTDLGPDGRGGGTLRLLIHVNAGDLEVTR
ncbi:PspC domain-containing protein [Micromonospora sp. DR5-3]|uniref:PspC domain-containing protein n=1 Tax=unclassified Micromonospora TaxID=2617518 RepID=UPI0011DA639B|nr:MULTISPECIES: PspC domain-containing protein [unclassified Micromonospora]MCW3817996.1 PspC domain-containing protein [Micromonospora sp. DR5-3]TYC26299.1 PspC domain-containing protein [Micromonospora sp. MP36]